MVDSLFFELSNCQQENFELKARVRLLEEQLACANAAVNINSDELAIVARHREEVLFIMKLSNYYNVIIGKDHNA